jgi:hypothetical protein
MASSKIRGWGWATLLLLPAAMGLAGEPNPYQGLIDNSPFLTPAFKARLGQRDNIAMTFIGYTQIGEVWFFAILDRKTGVARWLKMGEEQNGIKVEQFEEKEQKIHLTVGGIAFDLTLEKEKK